jgi:hypothetical protein
MGDVVGTKANVLYDVKLLNVLHCPKHAVFEFWHFSIGTPTPFMALLFLIQKLYNNDIGVIG